MMRGEYQGSVSPQSLRAMRTGGQWIPFPAQFNDDHTNNQRRDVQDKQGHSQVTDNQSFLFPGIWIALYPDKEWKPTDQHA
jgi:hypothetical protein